MRRREFHASPALGRELFETAEVMHLAGVSPEGAPVLKTVHGVVDDGWVCFHASPAGEKTTLVGRPVVASVEETVARLPSYFTDPQKACPATTLYRAAQVHGVLQPIDDPPRKARVLQRLMEKLQPEGGYVPLDAESPMYRAAVKGLLLAGVPLDSMTVKAKLGQNRTPEQRTVLLQRLWERGAPGDLRALELMREANPGTPVPDFLRAPDGYTVHAWLPPALAPEAAALLQGEYWNDVFTTADLERAHRDSPAWVGVKDAEGRLVATARAIGDGGKYAWIYDVCVHARLRRTGLGKVLVSLLLTHPVVRHCRRVKLATRDAQALYARFGFVPSTELPPRPYASTEMTLVR